MLYVQKEMRKVGIEEAKQKTEAWEHRRTMQKKETSVGALSASRIGFTIPHFLPSVNKHGTSKSSFAHSE